jgi:hypothetical protein
MVSINCTGIVAGEAGRQRRAAAGGGAHLCLRGRTSLPSTRPGNEHRPTASCIDRAGCNQQSASCECSPAKNTRHQTRLHNADSVAKAHDSRVRLESIS